MFRIGEFSKIAQVSGRQLRHYDQLGLLVLEHIDPQTGYRYYSARQLPQLNRILALKELGLSLEQIARLLNDHISADEIRGMLAMKKAQIEQMLHEELARVRYIESRIRQIDIEGQLENYDIVLKTIPEQKFLAMREVCNGLAHGRQLLGEISQTIPPRVGSKVLGHMAAIIHSDIFEQDRIDMELGYLLNEDIDTQFSLPDGQIMTVKTLSPVETMLTVVRVGPSELGHGSYSALGTWAEANGYRFSGCGREIFLQVPPPGQEDEFVAEIQYPVERMVTNKPLLT